MKPESLLTFKKESYINIGISKQISRNTKQISNVYLNKVSLIILQIKSVSKNINKFLSHRSIENCIHLLHTSRKPFHQNIYIFGVQQSFKINYITATRSFQRYGNWWHRVWRSRAFTLIAKVTSFWCARANSLVVKTRRHRV